MYLAGTFIILALAGIGSATPLCDGQTYLLCLMPGMVYAVSPEGQQLEQLTDNDITETQLVSLCRMDRTAVQCLTGAVDRCINSDRASIREFMTGMNSLLAVCDRPDLYSKMRVLIQCGKTLINDTRGSKPRACLNAAIKQSAADVKGQQGRSTSDQWRSGNVMQKLCCNLKYYETCSGTEVAEKCGAPAQQVVNDMYRAFMTAFNCNGSRIANCPARPPPTEEDATVAMDLNQFLVGVRRGMSMGMSGLPRPQY